MAGFGLRWEPHQLPVFYNVAVTVITTNDDGNFFQVFSNLNVTLGPYYGMRPHQHVRASVSGVLALMEDSSRTRCTRHPVRRCSRRCSSTAPRHRRQPAHRDQSSQFPGLGPRQPAVLPPAGLTNLVNNPTHPMFFLDQSPTNALATGDSQTFTLSSRRKPRRPGCA